MGIYDRDYARPSSNRGFGGGMQRPQKLSVNAWLIISCIAVFVLDPFISYTFQEWLHLSTDHVLQYWRFIGFQFLHADMQHLIFNMIGLYFFGSLVEQFLGGKRYLAFYLLCGMFGAVLYLLLNLGGIIVGKDVPILLFNDTSVRLIGASAGVFGVLLAGAFLAPKVRVLVFFVIPMQLSTMAYLLVGLALYTVIFAEFTNIGSVENAGGEAAHLGGAAAGWYFIRNPHHLNGFFDFLGKADPTSKHFALGKKKTARSDVDKILDKIHRKGLNSLSSKEKKILHDASQDRREGE
jgi:membrane associated rhomboid family serine protease